MKKETKRYYLVEYLGSKTKRLSSVCEYEKMLKDISLYNKRKYSKYLCGNVSYIVNCDDSVTATIHIYNRLMGPLTISEIDSYTSSFTEEELMSKFESEFLTKEEYTPDVNVCYFETKNIDEDNRRDIGIKYIPVIYRRDKQFLDLHSIRNYLKFQADTHSYGFFKKMCSEFCFYQILESEIEELYKIVDKVEHQGLESNELYRCSLRLFNKFIKEYDKNGRYVYDNDGNIQISKRRLRDFGMYIRNYNSEQKSPFCYNGTLKHKNQYKKVKDK